MASPGKKPSAQKQQAPQGNATTGRQRRGSRTDQSNSQRSQSTRGSGREPDSQRSQSTRGSERESDSQRSQSTRGLEREPDSQRSQPTRVSEREPDSQRSQPTRGSRIETGNQRSQSNAVSIRGSGRPSTSRRSTDEVNSSTGCPLTQRNQLSVVDQTKDLERILNERLNKLTLRKERTNRNASTVNQIQEIISRYLQKDDRCLKWEVCRSGSYYEKTKINNPDEYDCMMVCNMRCKPDYSVSDAEPDSKSFCALRTLAVNASGGDTYPVSNPRLLSRRMDNGVVYFSPRAFKKHFRDKILDAIEQSSDQLKGFEIDVQLNDPGCPAVTLTVRGVRESPVQRFSIDIVPAIRLLAWPKPAKSWRLLRMPALEHEIKHPDESGIYPFAVAKIHHTEKSCADDECILWRISFSAAEKQLILHADQSSANGRTCRKSVLRLLKSDLAEFQTNNGSDGVAVSSFHIKTTFLHLLDAKPSDNCWSKDELLVRYTDGLRMLVECLHNGDIRHYFIRDANLLDERANMRRQLNALETHFRRLLRNFSV